MSTTPAPLKTMRWLMSADVFMCLKPDEVEAIYKLPPSQVYMMVISKKGEPKVIVDHTKWTLEQWKKAAEAGLAFTKHHTSMFYSEVLNDDALPVAPVPFKYVTKPPPEEPAAPVEQTQLPLQP